IRSRTERRTSAIPVRPRGRWAGGDHARLQAVCESAFVLHRDGIQRRLRLRSGRHLGRDVSVRPGRRRPCFRTPRRSGVDHEAPAPDQHFRAAECRLGKPRFLGPDMRIIYDQPFGSDVTWTIQGGEFIGDPDDLCNGNPASACRVKWHADSSGSPGSLVLIGSFTARAVGAAAFLSPRFSTENVIPEGVKIDVSGKLTGSPVALGGNALNMRTVTHPNGATRRPWVFPAHSIDQIII